MDLSIIIVNWNSCDYLKDCIAALTASIKSIKFEIIVIDNASYDGCGEMLRQFYPQVKFIQSSKNIGFGKANNEAYKSSQGRNILFLNPDTEIKGSSVVDMFNNLCNLKDAGAVGAKLLNTDGSVQTSCIQAFPTILNQVLDADAIRRLMPRSFLWGMAPLFQRSQTAVDVDMVSGACLMIKRTVFENVGMFSDEYFMYSEDVDLCFKVRKAGWRVYFVPTARVIHHGGMSSSKADASSFSSIMMLESRWRFFRKNRSLCYAQAFRAAIFCISLIRLGLLSLIWLAFKLKGNCVNLQGTFRKWKSRFRWSLCHEKWVETI